MAFVDVEYIVKHGRPTPRDMKRILGVALLGMVSCLSMALEPFFYKSKENDIYKLNSAWNMHLARIERIAHEEIKPLFPYVAATRDKCERDFYFRFYDTENIKDLNIRETSEHPLIAKGEEVKKAVGARAYRDLSHENYGFAVKDVNSDSISDIVVREGESEAVFYGERYGEAFDERLRFVRK